MYLLDTNVVSELRKAASGKADANVAAWAGALVPASLYISVVTLEELEIGVRLAERKDPNGGRVLRGWLDGQVGPAFAGRILPIDEAVARTCAALHVPDPRPVRDGYIAATALVHGLTVATRNTTDFAATGAALVDPWAA